jgi:cell pole-organizing protein PopZ
MTRDLKNSASAVSRLAAKGRQVTMAQTNTVQREPSMEEILASIRKIIEESDGVRGTPAQPDEPAVEAPAEIVRSDLGEVEAFRADLALRREPPEAAAVERPSAAAMALRTEEEASAPTREGESVFPIDDAELAAELSELTVPEVPAVQPAADEARQGILSHHVQKQVAQSFGELSEAFLASRRRSFDEMAEEMLRPMLQDWLDNNLPVLVERLVREEIERVARGVTG